MLKLVLVLFSNPTLSSRTFFDRNFLKVKCVDHDLLSSFSTSRRRTRCLPCIGKC
jgi:hypothetical protein